VKTFNGESEIIVYKIYDFKYNATVGRILPVLLFKMSFEALLPLVEVRKIQGNLPVRS